MRKFPNSYLWKRLLSNTKWIGVQSHQCKNKLANHKYKWTLSHVCSNTTGLNCQHGTHFRYIRNFTFKLQFLTGLRALLCWSLISSWGFRWQNKSQDFLPICIKIHGFPTVWIHLLYKQPLWLAMAFKHVQIFSFSPVCILLWRDKDL